MSKPYVGIIGLRDAWALRPASLASLGNSVLTQQADY